MKAIRLIIFACIYFYNPASHASLIFSPSVFYKSYEEEMNGSKSKINEFYYDIKLGYAASSGLYLGGIYSAMTRDTGGTELERNSYGASVGFTNTRWFLLGHYFLQSEYEMGANAKFKDGSGFQADVGYWFQLAKNFSLGPQITYRSLKYDKLETSVGSTTLDFKVTEFMPYIALALIF